MGGVFPLDRSLLMGDPMPSSVGGVLDSMRKRLASDPELAKRCQHIQRCLTTGQRET